MQSLRDKGIKLVADSEDIMTMAGHCAERSARS